MSDQTNNSVREMSPERFFRELEARFRPLLDDDAFRAADEPLGFVEMVGHLLTASGEPYTRAAEAALQGVVARWRAQAVSEARAAALREAHALVASGRTLVLGALETEIAAADERTKALRDVRPSISIESGGEPGAVH